MYGLPGRIVSSNTANIAFPERDCRNDCTGQGYTWIVFELTLSSSFSAAHALVIKGVREPVHGHDWQVEATFRGDSLDEDGLLLDFHALEADLEAVIGPFRTSDLNASPAFRDLNPSAEEVARLIGRQLLDRLPGHVSLARISVTEAPGCKAAWLPEGHGDR
ncbi:MAG: 6-carboxytetrahydropterin synthase [Phycisphaerales bacterium]|nr:6-carboxytetrahydropterin synthase [Phycisphaerales bacterium]